MAGPRPSPRAVIFDMDGLIVDSEPFWRRVEASVFDEMGVDIRRFLGHGQTMGLRVDEAITFLCRAAGLVVDEDDVCRRVVRGVVGAIESEAELLPGAEEALEACAGAGLGVALATGSTSPVIDAVLDRFALRHRFSAVLSAEDDPFGKPHPAIFLRAAAMLGVEAVACVVVEDSLNGCIAGKAARMGVIAVPAAEDADDPRYAIADLRLESLSSLLDGEAAVFLGLGVGVERLLNG